LRMNPEFAEAWNLRATIHYLLRNYPASIRDIEATLELNPRHFGALNGLALILEQSGYDELALEAYDRVARLSPNRRGLRESIARVQSRILAKSH
ncbi:MAG: tetratricopeptide repeat protein, partial [Rhodobacteraceae bacterium]|nr:tetratricopeptide repeat protein [Paracoccaceae bacterium]